MPPTPPSQAPGRKPRGKSPARQAHEALKQERQQRAVVRSKREVKDAGKASALKRAEQRSLKKAERLAKYKELEDLRTRAVKAGLVVHGLNPVQVLQRLIDDSFIEYVLAQQDLDQERTNNNPDPRLIRQLEQKIRGLRKESAYFAGLSVQYNLQERQTQVQEARISLMVAALQRTLKHPDINLPPDKIREIPRLMQQTLIHMRQEHGKEVKNGNG